MEKLTKEALFELSKKTQDYDYEGMTFTLRKMKAGQAVDASKKKEDNVFKDAVACLVSPELTEEELRGCPAGFLNRVAECIADINGIDVGTAEKN